MRILRLSNSNDINARIPPERRMGSVVKALLEERLQETVEVQTRLLWPTPRCPELVSGWAEEFEPDIVYFLLSEYWTTYESVPLMLRRRFGRVGARLARLGKDSANTPWFAENAVFHRARNLAVRTIGGATPFTVDEALAAIEATVRLLARREETVIVVRGPAKAMNSGGDKAGLRRNEKRLASFSAGAQAIAERYRTEWLTFPAHLEHDADPSVLLGDRIHRNEEGHLAIALAEAETLSAIWARLNRSRP